MNDNYHQQQKLIHKIPLSSKVNLFLRNLFFMINDCLLRAQVNVFSTTVFRLVVPTARRSDVSRAAGFFDPVVLDERQHHGGDFVLPKR